MAKKQTINPIYKKYAAKVMKSIMTEDFYEYFMDVVSAGKNKFQFSNRRVEKEVDETWVVAIENTIKPFEEIINNPRNFIRRDEIIVNVALAKKVTPESIRHLASHGDMVDDYNNLTNAIRPNRLQETVKEDSWDTYENKFVYTLLEMTWEFVDKRYEAIFAAMNEEYGAYLKMEGESQSYQENWKYNIDLRVQQEDDLLSSDDKNMNIFSRIARLHRILGAFRSSSFAKEMKKYPKVKPPLVPTNAIKKNPNFKACHKLWNFILAYKDIGYKIEIYEQSNEIGEDFTLDIFNSVFFNYIILKNHLELADDREIDTSRQFKKKALKPRYIKEIVEEIVKNYDIPDVEIRKVLIEEMTKADLMQEEENERRRLVEEKEREMEEKRKKEEQEAKERAKAEEAERKRLEKERIAEEKRLEKERIAEEKRIQREKEQAEAEEASKARNYDALIQQMESDRQKVLAKRLEAARIAEKIAAEAAEKKRKAEEAEAERVRIEKEKAEEKARIKAEAEAEKKRLAEEAAKEKARIAAEKQAEKQRIQEEKKASKLKAEQEKAAARTKADEEKAANKARIAAEKAAVKAAENAEKQRIKAEETAAKALEKERIAKEKAEAKAAAEDARKAEKLRIEKEKAAAKKEAEKLKAKARADEEKAKAKAKADAEKAKAKAKADAEKAKAKAKADAEKAKAKAKADAEKAKAKADELKAKEKEKAKADAEKAKAREKAAALKSKEKEKARLAADKKKAKEKASEDKKKSDVAEAIDKTVSKPNEIESDTIEKIRQDMRTSDKILDSVENDVMLGKLNKISIQSSPSLEANSVRINDDSNYAYGDSNSDATELTAHDEQVSRISSKEQKGYVVDLRSVSAPTFTGRPIEGRKENHRNAKSSQIYSPFLKEVLENSEKNPFDEETIKKISEEISNNSEDIYGKAEEVSKVSNQSQSKEKTLSSEENENNGFFRSLFRRR